MENKIIRKPGRPKIFTEEELKQRHRDYMKNTLWFCNICEKSYKIPSKYNHLKSKIHQKNVQILGQDTKISHLLETINKLSIN